MGTGCESSWHSGKCWVLGKVPAGSAQHMSQKDLTPLVIACGCPKPPGNVMKTCGEG